MSGQWQEVNRKSNKGTKPIHVLPRPPTSKPAHKSPTIETVPKLPVAETVSKLPVAETVSKLPVAETVSKLPVAETVSKLPTVKDVSETPISKSVSSLPTDESSSGKQKHQKGGLMPFRTIHIDNPDNEEYVSDVEEEVERKVFSGVITIPDMPEYQTRHNKPQATIQVFNGKTGASTTTSSTASSSGPVVVDNIFDGFTGATFTLSDVGALMKSILIARQMNQKSITPVMAMARLFTTRALYRFYIDQAKSTLSFIECGGSVVNTLSLIGVPRCYINSYGTIASEPYYGAYSFYYDSKSFAPASAAAVDISVWNADGYRVGTTLCNTDDVFSIC
jgi:hypothetical protein